MICGDGDFFGATMLPGSWNFYLELADPVQDLNELMHHEWLYESLMGSLFVGVPLTKFDLQKKRKRQY